MDSTTNSRCIFCKKVNCTTQFKVGGGEDNWSLQNELTGDYIIEGLLNIETHIWKEKLGVDLSQPLTISLCRCCAHKVRECFSWHQLITRTTTFLENSRRELTEQLFLSGLFSGDAPANRDLSYCDDDNDTSSDSEHFTDFATADGFNSDENQVPADNSTRNHDPAFCNDDMDDIPSSLYIDFSTADDINTSAPKNQINNSPRNKNEDKALFTSASSRNNSQLNSSSYYDDVSSVSSMEISPEHRTPSQQISRLSSPPVLPSLEKFCCPHPSCLWGSPCFHSSRSLSSANLSESEHHLITDDRDREINDAASASVPETAAFTSIADMEIELEQCKDDNEVKILPSPTKPQPEVITMKPDDDIYEIALIGPGKTRISWSHIEKRQLKKDEVTNFSPWVQDQVRNLSVYKCPECCAFYEKRIWFEHHMRRHHEKLPYKCGICEWHLDFSRLGIHRLYAHDANNRTGKINCRGPFEENEVLEDFTKFGGEF